MPTVEAATDNEDLDGRFSGLISRLRRLPETNKPERLTPPGRRQFGIVGEISPGDIKSVHPGEIIGIRSPMLA
jgi:hypothetical protein